MKVYGHDPRAAGAVGNLGPRAGKAAPPGFDWHPEGHAHPGGRLFLPLRLSPGHNAETGRACEPGSSGSSWKETSTDQVSCV